MSMFKFWMLIVSTITFSQLVHSQNNNDIFLQIQGFNGEVCQGTRIENKVITSALCFCKLYSKDANDLEELVSLFKKKKDKYKILKLLNTSLGKEKEVSVKVHIDEHACRYAENWRNESPDSESSKMLYDKYFFDVAILEIIDLPVEFKMNSNYPQLTCVRPRNNDFLVNGTMGIITRDDSEEVQLNEQRFSLRNKPNYWYIGLEVFFTGYRVTSFDQHFSTNEKQNGAPLISLSESLLIKNEQGKITHGYDFAKVKDILQNEQYQKIFIPGVITHGQKIDVTKGRAIYGVPFFNVKKLLKKHIPFKYLSSDCLSSDYPEGFHMRLEIY